MTQSNKPERKAFESSDEFHGLQKGVKLKNKTPPPEKPKDFEAQVNEFMTDKQQRNKEMLKLCQEFLGLLSDHTLAENKSVMVKDLEKELISKLVQSALVINQDDTEPEGMGSVALINLLLKIILQQKDRINELDYKILLISQELDYKISLISQK